MEPVSLTDFLAATRAEMAGGVGDGVALRRVSVDSRTLKPGDLFWALRGTKHDGHEHVVDALRRGAAACVVDRRSAAGLSGPLFVVDDTLRALGEFACWYRRQRETLIIGVTGSVGKTTTREMLHAVLSVGDQCLQRQ